MQWTDYLVKKNIDELKDLTFEQAGKVAEMLNEREPTAKIDDLEDRLYDSEREYENLEDNYNDLESNYEHLERKFEEIKKRYNKLENFFVNLEAFVLKTRKLTDDIELSNYCDVIVNKFNKFRTDK